jgi:2,5-furandicarboxylate decarboxylase 1
VGDQHLDLRAFIQSVKENSSREYLQIDDNLSADWELAACTTGLESKLRVPLIKYTSVAGSAFPVVHNVCSSLPRIARSIGESAGQLEERLDAAYDQLIAPTCLSTGPVRDVIHDAATVDLYCLPNIRYTQSESHGYLSAACLVAQDPNTQSLNLSFHRLMVVAKNRLAIYMTPGGHLDRIFRSNQLKKLDTPVAAFIGSHPLWSLGCLAAGPLSLDEYSVIGALLGTGLEVVPALAQSSLLVPARAEFSLEGVLRHDQEMEEGPYGEAFGYTSIKQTRPVFELSSLSYRHDAIFQDIVPGHQEHMVMTSAAIRVHLNRTLTARYPWITSLHLPAPMTLYIAASSDVESQGISDMLRTTLSEERFVKMITVFDDSVNISSAKETQKAIAVHVQADRDMVILPAMSGNGLDPSERDGKTTKWGIDATATSVKEGLVEANRLPDEVLSRIDISDILARALAKNA